MLEVSRLTLGYRRHPICDDVSVGVGPGEIVALVAPNGAGKTTMLRAIGCQPSDVRMGGACVADGIGQQDDERLYRRRVLFVPDDGNILQPRLTVREQIKTARALWGARDVNLDDVVERSGVGAFLDQQSWRLSRGMQQQASLAIACATGARYLLLDEPTNGLDIDNTDLIEELLLWLAESGVGILISSHILSELDRLCGRVVFLHDRTLVGADLDGGFDGCRRMYRQRFKGGGVNDRRRDEDRHHAP